MIKKNIVFLFCFAVIVTLILPLPIDAKKDYSSFVNKNARKSREYTDNNGKSFKLTYTRTETMAFVNCFVPPKKRIDVYGTYDLYVDKEKTEYYYLYNTNKLCLKRLNYKRIRDGEKYEKEKISESKAKEIANQYLKKELGKRFNDYTFQSVSYGVQDATYSIFYSRMIDGYFTDDCISLSIDYKGNIYVFSALNLERFKKYSKSDINQESIEKAREKDSDINNIRLILNENTGQLVAITPHFSYYAYTSPESPKLSITTKKITSKTKSIKGKVIRAVKNRTYIVCSKYKNKNGKMTKQIAEKKVTNGKINFKVNLQKLKKGEKIKIYTYTIYNKKSSDKLFKKKSSSKIFSIT